MYNKRKVLFIVNIPSPYRVDFFNELGKSCDLTVVFEGRFATDRNKKWTSGDATFFHPVFLDGIRIRSDGFFSLKILKILRLKWDFIFIGGYSTPTLMISIEYLKHKGIDFCLEVDGGVISKENLLLKQIKKHFISSASCWMSTGKATTEYLVHYGADINKCYTYPFSSIFMNEIILVDAKDKNYYSKKRDELRNNSKEKLLLNNKKVVLAVGQIIYRKGYDVLLKSMLSIKSDCEIVIVGGNPPEEYIHFIKNNNLNNVRFVDFLSKKDLFEYFVAADVFVHPTREDIWGLVINEAFAYGLPVITTDRCVAGIELIEPGVNGYIIKSEDDIDLAKTIDCVLMSDSCFGFNAMKTAQRYTIELMAEAHLKIINK